MQNKKNEKYIKIVVTVLIIVALVWFLVLSPLLKFRSMEKTLLNAAKRYFEVNENLLPTGNRLRKISLDTLYDKEFVKEDLRAPYTNTLCNSSDSWVKVSKNKKDDTKYDYNVYLECGVFRSKIDHTGPTVKLNGEDEITMYIGDKYKEQGVSSITDDTDGNIDIKKVKIDSSKVNTDKAGTYEVTYEISDSLENKTIKKRIVKVTQTLNNILKKGTDNNTYLKIDGILFTPIGINSDKTVKVVSSNALASLDYNSVDKWLNEYFYEKLSDSAKSYIVKSKWCSDKVNDPNNYSKCKNYSKEKYVGLLSISDYKNAKSENDVALNNEDAVWTYSKKDNNNAWINSYRDVSAGIFEEYKASSSKKIVGIKPAVNIKKDAVIVSGEGTNVDPYILEGNNKKAKPGDKLSESVTGSYIKYSGYNFRVISKEEDGTVKVIMLDSLISNDGDFYTEFDTVKELYNPNKKTNIAYKIANKASEFIKIDYFDTKQIEVKQYTNVVSYDNKLATNKYKAKLSLASLFDLYSTAKSDGVSTWYKESSNKENYINSASIGTVAMEFDKERVAGIKLVGYLNKDVVIKTGEGTSINPYTLTK